MTGTAAKCREDTRTVTTSGCWGELKIVLGEATATSDPGDNSGFWHGVNATRARCDSVADSGIMVGLGGGSGTRVRFEGTVSGAWVQSIGTGIEDWATFEGAGLGTRLGVQSLVWMPTSGIRTDVMVLTILYVSIFLVRLKISGVWVAEGLLQVLAFGVERPFIEVVFKVVVGIIEGPSVVPSELFNRVGGTVVLTIRVECVLRLQVL